jgi:hypothetical protein
MVMGDAQEKRLEVLKVSLEQARAGKHPRIVAEDKRLKAQKAEKLAKATKLRDFRLGMVQVRWVHPPAVRVQRRAACAPPVLRLLSAPPPPPLPRSSLCLLQTHFEAEKKQAEEEFNREKGALQDKMVQDIVERQRRHTKVDAPELRAVTRKMRTLRGEQPAQPGKGGKRETKAATSAIPLRQVSSDRIPRLEMALTCAGILACSCLYRTQTWGTHRPVGRIPASPPAFCPPVLIQGEVEEDFEAMATAVHNLAPHLEIDLEMEVAPSKRLRPVEPVRRGVPDPGPPGKRRRADFDFKGKVRNEVPGARITVWYEEEHNGRKTDVPYQGVVSTCDAREGLYVKFEGSPEEMLITNEDDWRWGAHTRKPPESSRGGRGS